MYPPLQNSAVTASPAATAFHAQSSNLYRPVSQREVINATFRSHPSSLRIRATLYILHLACGENHVQTAQCRSETTPCFEDDAF